VTDAFWSSGDLHPSHRLSTEDNCLDCHQVLFSMVKNEACLDCHQFTLDHVQVVDATAHGLESERCGSCHREHNEPPMLIDARSALCIDCHESPGGIEREADPLASVVGFNANDHPNFEVTLPAMHAEDSGPVSWSWSHLPVAGAKENSNLKFPHDVHLDPEQVTRLTNGDPLACLDCHQLSTDKEHFIPVMMETHCESCHELKFDDANPFRRLPHGDASEAIRMMEGHFLKKALSITGDAGPAVKWRRIPDRPPRGEVCNESKGECAEEAFLKEVEEQFLRTGCVSCHEVETLDTDYVVERYRVVPVLLPTDFFPTQFFDHASHLIMEDMIGDAACSSCHSAIDSSESSDLLIPDAKDCYSCHGDENTESLVQMNCVNCHAYHPSSLSSNVDIFK
jgi:predicted CXXCH cytochrome family protein